MAIAPFYTLITQERFLAIQWLQSMKQKLSQDVPCMSFETPKVALGEILDQCNTFSMFEPIRLIVVHQSKELNDKDQKMLLGYLASPAPDVHMVWRLDKVDKRKTFYKTLKKNSEWVELQVPKLNQMSAWVGRWLKKTGLSMAPDAVSLLIENVGCDVGRAYHELDKVALFVHPRKNITHKDIETMVMKLSGEDVFACTDAIIDRNAKKALESMHYLLAQGVHGLAIMSLLSRHIRILCKVLSAKGQSMPQSSWASYVGVPPFTVRRYKKQAEDVSFNRCVKSLKLLAQLDQSLKSGFGNSNILLEKSMITLTQLR